MNQNQDRLRPTQPYLVLDTEDFYQEVYLQQGISHFYTCRFLEKTPLRIVPDGCIDLFFKYKKGKMQGVVCGTTLEYTCTETKDEDEVFGVRFMPGYQPKLVRTSMRALLDDVIPIRDILVGDDKWLDALEKEEDFFQRIRIFLEAYTKVENQVEKPYGKKELVQSVKQMVYLSNGKIKVSQMQEETGYSQRYINKVFLEEMGFSPKTFCKIIQFQRALELLNYGKPENMTDAAVSLGYYDQPQFIRDFTHYAGVTPNKYLNMIKDAKYVSRIGQKNPG